MHTIYHLSASGKRRMRRRIVAISLVSTAAVVTVFTVLRHDQFDSAGNSWLGLLPFVLLAVIGVVQYRILVPRIVDSYAVLLSEGEIAIQTMGRTRTSIAHDRVARVEADDRGQLFIIGGRKTAAVSVPFDVDGIEELRSRLSLLHGGIQPRGTGRRVERLLQVFGGLAILAFLAIIAFDTPVVVLPAALIYLMFTGWGAFTTWRTMGFEGGRKTILMTLIPVPFVMFKVVSVLGSFH
jgi:hypothetical protein